MPHMYRTIVGASVGIWLALFVIIPFAADRSLTLIAVGQILAILVGLAAGVLGMRRLWQHAGPRMMSPARRPAGPGRRHPR